MIDSVSEVEVSPSKRDPDVVERTFLIADVRGYTRFTRSAATPRRHDWRAPSPASPATRSPPAAAP